MINCKGTAIFTDTKLFSKKLAYKLKKTCLSVLSLPNSQILAYLQQTMKLLENVEGLVINALRFKPHYSHFCVAQALEIIEKIKPKQAYLTHCSHDIGLYVETSRELPENVHLAYDGLTIEL